MSELVKELREYATDTCRTAWWRKDGGQELAILSVLADKAADRIEALEAERDMWRKRYETLHASWTKLRNQPIQLTTGAALSPTPEPEHE